MLILKGLEGKPEKSTLIFKVDSFRNPADAIPRKTIKVSTMDVNGFRIDSATGVNY